ncbi:hypothetical protein DFH11DRAFT_1503102 [Phellopilus nigrolimitatus]|nr:hypothetical protein DFH11DRAFT_1503102 [Phellopilus nigrolimitatus]
MYGTRTKKVVSYGRRAQRFIPDDRRFGGSSFSPNTKRSELAEELSDDSKNTDEQADVYVLPSVQKSSAASRRDKPQRAKTSTSPHKPFAKKLGVKGTPDRRPLGVYQANVPNSPAMPPKNLRTRSAVGKNTPSTLRKVSAISPYVDVDIIVIDNSGRRFSQERRVTKTNAPVHEAGVGVPKTKRLSVRPTDRAAEPTILRIPDSSTSEDDDDDEYIPTAKIAKGRRTKRAIVISDSESDHESGPPPKLQPDSRAKRKSTAHSRNNRGHEIVTPLGENNLKPLKPVLRHQVEVVIPLPPRIPSVSSTATHATTAKKHDAVQVKTYAAPQHIPTIHAIPSSPEHASNVDLSSAPPPRQLTPIRPTRSMPAFLQQKAKKSGLSQTHTISDDDDDDSVSMDEELELALKVADLELSESMHAHAKPSNTCKSHIPSYLRPLLSECGQISPFDFSTFIETFPFSEHIGFSDSLHNEKYLSSFQKVGEASYSEVFGIGNVVLKIVPLFDEGNETSMTWTADWDSPPVSEAKDVLKEILVTRAMGEICKGFIKLLKAHIVQGPYPPSLLTLWDVYNETKGSESIRPDFFSEKQAYAIIILPNGGPDLESFSFASPVTDGAMGWRQACSVFWQVTRSLGRAEELVHFEHRDLHWGQILVRRIPTSLHLRAINTQSSVYMDDPSHGVQSTIIDLGLSRIDSGHKDPYWTPFTEENFEGEGDYQYDVYRMMRKHNKDEWQSFMPLTNVMWLHYLADKLVNHKQIRPPKSRVSARPSRKLSRSDAGSAALQETDKRAYDCLVEVEKMLGLAVAPIARSVGAKARKRSKSTKGLVGDEMRNVVRELRSAADVLRIGKEKRWII